jgi:hypothetical protein
MPLVMNLLLQKQPYVYAVCTVTDTLTAVCSSWRWNDPCCHQGILTTRWFWNQCCVPKWPHPLCKLIQNLYCVYVCVCVCKRITLEWKLFFKTNDMGTFLVRNIKMYGGKALHERNTLGVIFQYYIYKNYRWT